ncbi:unnamed protein product [Effrenium voratum]|nr:unnamed protein product [Effrenium voratum]
MGARHEYCYLRKRPQESNLLQQQAVDMSGIVTADGREHAEIPGGTCSKGAEEEGAAQEGGGG